MLLKRVKQLQLWRCNQNVYGRIFLCRPYADSPKPYVQSISCSQRHKTSYETGDGCTVLNKISPVVDMVSVYMARSCAAGDTPDPRITYQLFTSGGDGNCRRVFYESWYRTMHTYDKVVQQRVVEIIIITIVKWSSS